MGTFVGTVVCVVLAGSGGVGPVGVSAVGIVVGTGGCTVSVVVGTGGCTGVGKTVVGTTGFGGTVGVSIVIAGIVTLVGIGLGATLVFELGGLVFSADDFGERSCCFLDGLYDADPFGVEIAVKVVSVLVVLGGGIVDDGDFAILVADAGGIVLNGNGVAAVDANFLIAGPLAIVFVVFVSIVVLVTAVVTGVGGVNCVTSGGAVLAGVVVMHGTISGGICITGG